MEQRKREDGTVIISHRHRFIFIKTAKTAGTTVELYLRQFCGPDDIVSPLHIDDELLARSAGIIGPQNHESRLKAPWHLRRRDIPWVRDHHRYPVVNRFYNHMPATLIRDEIGDEIWTTYTKFTIVRDPWDRVVSNYYWRNRKSRNERHPLEESVERAGNNWKLYTIDGRSEIDSFFRFESLQADLEALRDRLGFDGEVNLLRAKGGIRPQRSSARELLTEQQVQRIAELAHNEIEMFGYRWDGPEPPDNNS